MSDEKIEALEKKLDTLRSEPVDSELVETLNKLAHAELHSDPSKSEAYALEAYDLATDLGLETEKARSKIELATFHLEAGNFDKALSHCRCAMDIYENLGDKSGIANVHGRLGHMYLDQGLNDRALEHFHMALKCKQECSTDRKELAAFYFNIGACYATLDRLELALSFYEHAQSVWEEQNERVKLAILYNNIGAVFGKKGELDNAREYFLKALFLNEEQGDRTRTSSTLNNLGNLNEDLGEYQTALDYYTKSLELYEELGNRRGVAFAYCCVGSACTHLNRLDEAVKFAEKGLEMTRSLKVKDVEILCLGKITNLYEKRGELKKALMHSREINTSLEQHLNEKSLEKIAKLQVQFETEKKEKEAEIYRLKNEELSKINNQLREALAHVKKLQGMLPICASCKKVRDDDGYWQQIESYIAYHSEVRFSHGICPDCLVKLYGNNYKMNQSDN